MVRPVRWIGAAVIIAAAVMLYLNRPQLGTTSEVSESVRPAMSEPPQRLEDPPTDDRAALVQRSEPRHADPAEGAAVGRVPAGVLTTRIHVVHDRDGRPAPDATLRILTRGELDWRPGTPWGDAVLANSDGTAGQAIALDEHGAAVIERRREYECLVANLPGSFGAERVGDEDASLEVRLYETAELRFQVTDPKGRPRPEIPVAIQSINRGPTYSFHSIVAHAVAGPGEPFQRLQNARWVLREGPGDDEYRAFADVILREDYGTPIDPRSMPVDPIRLETPDVGSIRIQVRTDGTQELPSDIQLHTEWGGSHSGKGYTCDLVDGKATLFPVAAAPKFAGWLRLADQPPIRVEVPGDRPIDGEYLHDQVLQDPARTQSVLVGRILYADGTPAAGMRWQLVRPKALFAISPKLETDASGAFIVTLPANLSREGLRVVPRARMDARGDPKHFVDLALPLNHRVGRLDLGDLTLTDVPEVVRGRITDMAGAPVKGIVLTMDPEGNRRRRHSSLTDAEGRFSFHSTTEVAWGTISVRQGGFAIITDRRFESGDDVTYTLLPGNRVEGSLLVDDGVSLENLELIIRTVEGHVSAILQSDGTFSFGDVASGPCSIDVRIQAEYPAIAHTFADIEVPSEEPIVLLPPFDLRGLVNCMSVEVFGHDGGPVQATLLLFDRSAEYTNAFGRASILTSKSELEMMIEAEDHIPEHRAMTRGDHKVRLRAAPTLSIHGSLEGEVPDGYRLVARATRRSPMPPELAPFAYSLWTREIDLGDSGEVTRTVPLPGEYEVRLVLQKRRGSPEDAPIEGPAVTVDVPEAGHSDTIELYLDPRKAPDHSDH